MATNKKIPKCPPLRFPEFADEWKQTTLGEIASFCGGGTPSSEKVSYWNGHIPWISSSDISAKSISNIDITRFISEEALLSSATKLCKAPCIVIVSRVGVGKLAYSKNDICTSQDFCNMYDIKENYIFMSYLLLPMMNKKSLEVQGTSIKGITMQEIKSLFVSLPSLAEQEKIASFLSLIDERIQSCSETIKERKREKAALLNQLFSQKLRFPQFSDEWQQTTLGEICTIKTGKLDANAMIEGGRYPFFTCAKQTHQTDTYSFSGEAILVAGNGEVGLTKYYNGKFNAYQRTYVLQSLRRDIILRLIRNYIDDALPKRIVSLRNGSAMPYITLSTLRDMPIFLPSLAEQKKIADFLSLIDEHIEVEEELLEQYERQKRYLLRQMFT